MTQINRAIVYIDGFNLYNGLMDKFYGSYRWLDLGGLAKEITPPTHQVSCIKYYTSIIKGSKAKHTRQQTYLNALKAYLSPHYECMFGRFQLFSSRCKFCGSDPLICNNCGTIYKKPNEKKTDVNISTTMLVDCFENNTDAIVLISGDSDFETPLGEIGRLFPSVLRVIAFPPKRKNSRLYKFCDQYIEINLTILRNAGLLPDPVKNPNTGTEYIKPTNW